MGFYKRNLNWSDLKINDTLSMNIYALRGEDGTILYVGKTEFPRKRLACHITSKDSSCGSSNIPEDIRMSMSMEILEKCSKEKSAERERYWYQHFKPHYNKMILGGAPTTKTARQRYLDKHHGGVEPPPKVKKPEPQPKTTCECGKTYNEDIKERNLKQHLASRQHQAWAAKSLKPNTEDVPV
jgi:hypothetical protein